MKKLMILVLAVIFSIKSIAQSKEISDNKNQVNERTIERKMSKTDQSNFLKDSTVTVLIEQAKKMGYLADPPINASFEEASITTEGVLDKKKFSISMFAYKLKGKDRSDENTFDIVQYSDNINKITETWGETEKKVFTIVDGKLLQKEQTKSVQKSALSCLSQYLKPGLTSCVSCVNCVNSCGSQNKKWKKIACAWKGCKGSCGVCIANVYGFISCYFN